MTFNQSETRVRTTSLCLSMIAFLAVSAGASTGMAQQTRADTAASITLPNTRVHILHSRVNGRTYRIQVALPSAYINAPPGDRGRYSTLYLLDVVGNMFPFVYGFQQYAGFVHPSTTILVGVAPVEAPGTRPDRLLFDYTPPLTAADSAYFKGKPFPMPTGGGAPQFLRVLKEEIIPLIDSSYRTSGDRGIEGISLAGFFVAYAMLEEPDLFNRYAMISPSLWYPWGQEKGLILAREPEFAKQHQTFRKTVYVNVGSEENSAMIAAAWRFVRQLCSSLTQGNYKGLDLGAETIAGAPHGSPLAIMRSLRALYPWDSTEVRIGRGVMQDCR